MGCGASKSAHVVDDASSVVEEDDMDIDFIFVADTEPGYPPPKPPATRKKDIFKIEDYRDIEVKAKQASQDDASTYTSLVNYLTSDLNTDVQKVRSIFVWLGNQRIYNMSYPDVKDPNTPRGYMKLIKYRRGSYPSFFALLCRAAKIPCVIIRGKSKGAGFEVGDTDISNRNSTWNAVYVDRSWRIVHPYWAFTGVVGHETGRWTLIENQGKGARQKQVKSEGMHIYHRNEFYFLTNPDEFIYMCMASEKEWQLLPSPWTEADFVRVPMFSESYFSSGITLKSENVGVMKSKKGRVKISFKMLSERPLTYTLLFDEKTSEEELPKDIQADLYVLQNNEDKIKTFIIRFPVRGIYKMEINDGLCNFRLDCDSVGKNTNPFPTNPAIGFGYNLKAAEAGLTQPSTKNGIVIMDYGAVKKFQFKSIKELEIQVFLKHFMKVVQNLHEFINVEQNSENVIVTVTMPDKNVSNNPEYALEINAKEKGSLGKFENVCNYLISSDQKEWANVSTTKEMVDAKTKLIKATEGDDIEELEKAVLNFVMSRQHDEGQLTAAKERLVELHLKRLKEATKKRNLAALNDAIYSAEHSICSKMIVITEVMNEARQVQEQLNRLNLFLHKILELKQQTVSEIHSYNRPKSLIHDVMTATYLLLGEKEKQLKKWKYVQTLLRRIGKDSIVRCIKEFDILRLSIPSAKRADILLNQYKLVDVRQQSAGAGTFYVWSSNIISEKNREV